MTQTSMTIGSPLGSLVLTSEHGSLVSIAFSGHARGPERQGELQGEPDALLEEARRQLAAYFSGRLRDFDLPLAPRGTEFQRRVWEALACIPWGETSTYRDIARSIGRRNAMRAVGAANGANPLPIILPCHRVIGSNGCLRGYSGGLGRKRALLVLERVVID
jgi:methylated-DNA-[protein]-cysteine S-methyltransferase